MKQVTVLTLSILCVFFGCKKQSSDAEAAKAALRSNARPGSVSNTYTAKVDCNYVLNETALSDSGWTKMFEDNFDNGLAKWNIWTGGAFNNELQYYQASNLQLSAAGELMIVARKEAVTGATTPFDPTPKNFAYTSGRIECKTTVSASPQTPRVRMIARIKLAGGYGMWPAYWSYGDPWPTQGEIDMVEARGQEPTKYQTNYFYGKTANRNLVRGAEGFITADGDLTACYHIYEMVWAQNTLTSYIDGVAIETKSGGYIPNLFGKTERITLNLAVGGNFFSNLNPALIQPGTMYVDYVKVFTK
jgi:beta-glucanase (GH16 family)